jgi:hypothetical protein
MAKRTDGTLVFSIAASRSGKSQFVLSQVRRSKRLLVWDVEGEYAAKFGLEAEGKAALVRRLQRAQETDKSVLGNATTVNICRPNTRQDAEYIAGRFGIPLGEIPDADLQMLQRHKDRRLVRSEIRFEKVQGLPYLAKVAKFKRVFGD